MPQQHLNDFRGDTCSLLIELFNFCRRLLLKTFNICTGVTTTLKITKTYTRALQSCEQLSSMGKRHTSATFLWNSASIWERYSAISLSASSLACLSLADLAVENKKLSCLHVVHQNQIVLLLVLSYKKS